MLRYMPVGHFLKMQYHHHQGNSSEQNLIHLFLVTHICKGKRITCLFSADTDHLFCTEVTSSETQHALWLCKDCDVIQNAKLLEMKKKTNVKCKNLIDNVKLKLKNRLFSHKEETAVSVSQVNYQVLAWEPNLNKGFIMGKDF